VHQLAPLIYDLAVMLGSAGIVVLIFQRIRQPVVLGYLVAGMIVGPYTPPHALVNDIANIQILSELGVIFLMFSLGLEFSFHKLRRVGFSASVIGLIEVLMMVVIGYVAGLALGWTHYDSLFLGAALSISSTTIIIKAIDELGLKTKRFAELIFGVLIVEDLLAILLLVALSTIVVTKNVFSFDIMFAGVKLMLVVGGWFLVGYFILPPLFKRIGNYISQETLTIISVALCLTLVCAAANFHYSTALGAFIMGSILAETVLIHRIEELIKPIRDIFAAVFFISIGMLINPVVIWQNWPVVLLISVLTVGGKIISTSAAAILTGQSLNTSVRTGFGMAQIGEFSFIIAGLGISLSVTTDKLYPLIVAVSAITTFTTPYLIRLSGYISTLLEQRLPKRTRYMLDSYTAWVYRAQSSSQTSPFMRTIAMRIIVNGIIVAIIFAMVDYLVFHKYFVLSEDSVAYNVISLLVSLCIAAPFIWGMLFSYKNIKLPEYARTKLNPAVFLVWLITLSEIAILGILYFHTWITVIVFLVIGIVFFGFSYKQLERSYNWLEATLVENLKNKENDDQLRYAELAPWDTHLVEVEVGENSPFAGKTLSEGQIRQQYGVNIVAICHGARVIPAPRGEEKIISHDRLIVLGNDQQLDAFKKQIEARTRDQLPHSFLAHFSLKPFLVQSFHPFVGKTIRDSKIRESVNGLVAGLERENERILNPDPDTVLQVDDLLLLVGESEKIKQIG
jgi:CPA2 family monovalent cation:H+ antiporter-2